MFTFTSLKVSGYFEDQEAVRALQRIRQWYGIGRTLTWWVSPMVGVVCCVSVLSKKFVMSSEPSSLVTPTTYQALINMSNKYLQLLFHSSLSIWKHYETKLKIYFPSLTLWCFLVLARYAKHSRWITYDKHTQTHTTRERARLKYHQVSVKEYLKLSLSAALRSPKSRVLGTQSEFQRFGSILYLPICWLTNVE